VTCITTGWHPGIPRFVAKESFNLGPRISTEVENLPKDAQELLLA